VLRRFQACAIGAVLLLTTVSVSFGAGSIQSPTTVGSQSGTLTRGKAGSATFPISVTRNHNGALNVTFTVTFTGGTPAGIAVHIPSISQAGNTSPLNTTATFATTDATPAGSYTFRVSAYDGTHVCDSSPQVCTVSASDSVPEIDPGAATGALTVIAGLYLMFKDRRFRRAA